MKAITANRLGDGVAVYFTGVEWTERVTESQTVVHKTEIAELLDAARIDEQRNIIVAPYVIELDAVSRLPTDKKERVRAVGPSVRLDLNRTTGVL